MTKIENIVKEFKEVIEEYEQAVIGEKEAIDKIKNIVG